MNNQTIDCFFIGHNEMDFSEYEKTVRHMGTDSGAYRDLNLNFFHYENKPYTASEVFNAFSRDGKYWSEDNTQLSLDQTFSAAIAYLGTYLNRRNLTFDYVNSFKASRDSLKEKLEKENILTIAVITTLYVSVFPILEIIEFVRKHNRTAKIVVGGPFVSTQVRTQQTDALECLLKDSIGADFYVNSSQGEATLVKLISALKEGRSVEGLENIYYRTTGGRLLSTPVNKEDNRLSENMVNWDLFSRSVQHFASVRTAISCPFSCSFCGFPEHAGKYQTADVDAVEKELIKLDKIETLKDVHFIDDTFNVPLKRFKEILRMMIRNKFSFKWHSYFRCQFADLETVELMKESGCEGVFLGIESGCPQILENMNKEANVENYLNGISLLKEAGIVTFGNFIIGFPGETDDTIRQTREFIRQSRMDFYRAQLWYCEPITPIWEQRDKYRIQGDSFQWCHSTMDYKIACDFIDDIFLTIEDPVWVPIYNFDFDNIWHLVHRGMDIQQVKEFLLSFREGIKEKFYDPIPKREVGFEIINRIKKACMGIIENEHTHVPKGSDIVDDSDAEFDF